MNFIQRFLNCFDTRPQFEVIDHGDPDALFLSPPIMMGSSVAKPPASLERFRSHYGGKWYTDSGERVDAQRNREVLCSIMPDHEWRDIEAKALARL